MKLSLQRPAQPFRTRHLPECGRSCSPGPGAQHRLQDEVPRCWPTYLQSPAQRLGQPGHMARGARPLRHGAFLHPANSLSWQRLVYLQSGQQSRERGDFQPALPEASNTLPSARSRIIHRLVISTATTASSRRSRPSQMPAPPKPKWKASRTSCPGDGRPATQLAEARDQHRRGSVVQAAQHAGEPRPALRRDDLEQARRRPGTRAARSATSWHWPGWQDRRNRRSGDGGLRQHELLTAMLAMKPTPMT